MIFKSKTDAHGNKYIGQFNEKTNDVSGVIRKFSSNGKFFSEMVMLNTKPVGLSRHIDVNGHVAYVIFDTAGKSIESKFFDKDGKPAHSDDAEIDRKFLKWIFEK